MIKTLLLVSVLASAVWLLCTACSKRERPANVSADATWVEGGKFGYWQMCQLTIDENTHCTVWNEGGEILLDEKFLPIDEKARPAASELQQLRDGGPCTGPYQVCLSDGRILVPASRFADLKAFIEGRPR